MATSKNRIVLTVLSVVIIAAALLFGGAGVTAYAAQNALPGDTLYGVKTTIEQTRLGLSRDASMRANLYMEFAENRLQEISRLITEQRFQDIATATADFEAYTQKAIAELELVAQGDPQQAAVLTAKISETLSRYARTLTSMLDSVPEPVKAQLQQVIQSSQSPSSPAVQQTEVEFSGVVETIVEGAWIINGKTVFIHSQTEIKDTIAVGDFVKVHAVLNSDGDLVAREIELDSSDDANSNDDSNSNDDDSNSNDDDSNSNDDDSNMNDDDNSNDDDSNSNDDDSNSNDDDSNSNDDDSNSNDDDSNSNDDDSNDDNSNDDYDDYNDNSDDSNDDNGNDDDSNDDDSNDNGDDD